MSLTLAQREGKPGHWKLLLDMIEAKPDSGFVVRMVPLDAGWSDLGAWDAVWQVSERDAQGNASQGDALFQGSNNTLVHATSRLVAAVGLDNIVVVETPDAVLVADRNSSQDVKKIVATLDSAKRTEGTLHRRVHRPWGWYDSIDSGPRFQVKRIMVKPKASLSLQMHHHRAEHWSIVRGEGVYLIDHTGRVFLALSVYYRHAGAGQSRGEDLSESLKAIVSKRVQKRARIVGAAIRAALRKPSTATDSAHRWSRSPVKTAPPENLTRATGPRGVSPGTATASPGRRRWRPSVPSRGALRLGQRLASRPE